MDEHSIVHTLFLVFAGAAIFATLALFTRQALLIAYVVIGILIGPSVINWVDHPEQLSEMANVGILFLLFLLGLNLELNELKSLFKEAVFVMAISSLVFCVFGFGVGRAFGFNNFDSGLIGLAMMFSSTIVSLKLLPTSALHHLKMGEIIVSILLLQDMLAILIMIGLNAFGDTDNVVGESLILIAGLPLLSVACWYVASRFLVKLYQKFDQIHEYLFLVAIAWCLTVSELAALIGLSHEVGAFIAGVTMASNPIARFVAENLKPLRDFFLVLFFVALGASLDLSAVVATLFPALLLALVSVLCKPWVFQKLLEHQLKGYAMARETGARLGQISEFSLLIIVAASQTELISKQASTLIQSATILSFVMSSFVIVRTYPTPIATDDRLRRD